MPRSRYRVFETSYPYFLTSGITAWMPVFSEPRYVEVVADSWRFLQRERAVQIFGYVVMENHLHLIASGPHLAEDIGRFKSFTARKIIDDLASSGRLTLLDELRFYKERHKLDQEFQLWQEGSHPQQIQCGEMMLQKLQYIHNNPLRRGYVSDPTHWLYSSARNYAGLSSMIEIETNWR
jgi:putative transposase